MIRKRGLGAVLILVALGPNLTHAEEPACRSGIRISFDARGVVPEGLAGKLTLRPAEEGPAPVVLDFKTGTTVSAELPCSSKWEASLDLPDFWAPRSTLAAGGAGEVTVRSLPLWPLGRIAGSIKLAEKNEKAPKKLVVTTLAARTPSQATAPRGSLDCPVSPDGRWTCPPLPASTYALTVTAEGFIPQYRWDFKVAPGKTAELGVIELKRGASVAGWVEAEGAPLDEHCRARLVPMVSAGSGLKLAEKVRTMALETTVRKDGFFQISGIAPGSYLLEVQQPGFAVAVVQPVQVSPRAETFLRQPVTLRRPVQVELAITPARDWIGRPWRVLVFRATDGGTSEAVFNGAASEAGTVAIPRQTPGRFRVEVTDAFDNQLHSDSFEVTGPEDARRSIDLDLLTVQGRLRYGQEPLAATLWFGGRNGSSSIKMDSGLDGKFIGVLPRAGWWRVEIAAAEPKLETAAKVKVEARGKDEARAEIDLPATRVFGKVLDNSGRPLPRASFTLSTDQGFVFAETDEAGGFDLKGASEGMAFAAATYTAGQEEWTSDRISLLLRDGENVGPLEVRLRRNKRFTGRVQSPAGPLPGAGVWVQPLRPAMMAGASVRSDVDGTFSAPVPAPTEALAIIVSPPGHALQAFASTVDATPALTVGLEGGSVGVLFPDPETQEGSAMSFWLFQNGLPIPTQILYQWTIGHGQEITRANAGKIRLPAMAPGEYRACLAAQAVLVSWEASGWTAPLAKCVSGHLSAGGELNLDLSSAAEKPGAR